MNVSPNEELHQLRDIVRVMNLCLDQYRQTITDGTGSDPAVRKACDRVEEWMVAGMREACDELGAGKESLGDAARFSVATFLPVTLPVSSEPDRDAVRDFLEGVRG